MIVDPWGLVLVGAPDYETAIVADLDFEALRDVRRRLPSLANRRPEAYAWRDLIASPSTREPSTSAG